MWDPHRLPPGAPPFAPAAALSAEGLAALRAFEGGLGCIDSSSACIQGLSAALVHAAHSPAVYHCLAALKAQIQAPAAAAAAGGGAAAAAAAGSGQLVLLLYVINDVLQRCCSCGAPFLLQLCLDPLRSLCAAAAAAAAAATAAGAAANGLDEFKRVLEILKQRDTFGGPEICEALMRILAGQDVQLPQVPKQLMLQQQQQQQQQRLSHKAADAPEGRSAKGPQTLDGYRLHYPSAADAATAAAAAAAIPAAPEDTAFKQQLHRTLTLANDCTLTIRDAQDSRKRQNARVLEVQQLLQRLASGEDTEEQQAELNERPQTAPFAAAPSAFWSPTQAVAASGLKGFRLSPPKLREARCNRSNSRSSSCSTRNSSQQQVQQQQPTASAAAATAANSSRSSSDSSRSISYSSQHQPTTAANNSSQLQPQQQQQQQRQQQQQQQRVLKQRHLVLEMAKII
ncbi:hypothetical protein, conserved [Eimeria tenella]|uniref:CID domain-containing protein n=1 Tax=Eimeria tenella TaxID=5802 RepID=U6KYL8_EIMTE|nr:hypothetical protein, conserved [Eimeria tenella]CDJ43056.1 hypothetical protein, conserved [Eimeria tenella]|eukprot:XP_013233806.1 hypothetical protein, conserved [Eimeria tenella]